jgi:twitching motility protein PilI
MSATSPFELLQDYDQRCRQNAKGLPTGTKVIADWVGIGFKLAGTRLIAPMSEVAEILPPPETIRVPGVLSWVKGLANIRGNLMPVLDMNKFLNSHAIDKRDDSRVLIIDRSGVVAALLVEEVFGLRRFKPDMRKDLDVSENGPLEPYLDGVFIDDQNEWFIFSVDRLVQHEQFLKVV